MFRTFRLLVLTAGLSALTVTPGHAVPIVDQSFTSPSNLATVINEIYRPDVYGWTHRNSHRGQHRRWTGKVRFRSSFARCDPNSDRELS